MKLRPNQIQALSDLRRALRTPRNDGRRNRAAVLCGGTGFGKTVTCVLGMVNEAVGKGLNVIVLAERDDLVKQMVGTHNKCGVKHFEWRGPNRRKLFSGQNALISSHQTLSAGKRANGRHGLPDGWTPHLIIVDECHIKHQNVEDMIADLVHDQQIAFAIGLSATPMRPGMDEVWDVIVNTEPTYKLAEQGVLVKPLPFHNTTIDVSGLKLQHGEWRDEDIAERGRKIMGDLIEDLKRMGDEHFGRIPITMGFGPTVKYCEEWAAMARDAGITAEVVSYRNAETKEGRLAKSDALDRFRAGKIQLLLCVDMLGRGFDAPCAECIQIARPFASSPMAVIQMAGRGLRPFPGKDKCLILDHGGNFSPQRFGQDILEFWSEGWHDLENQAKTKGEKRQAPSKTCPNCGHINYAAMKICGSCGEQLLEDGERDPADQPDADMVPLADAFADIDEGYLDLCLMRFALQMTVWTREKAKRFGTAADPRPLYTAAWGKYRGMWMVIHTPAKIRAEGNPAKFSWPKHHPYEKKAFTAEDLSKCPKYEEIPERILVLCDRAVKKLVRKSPDKSAKKGERKAKQKTKQPRYTSEQQRLIDLLKQRGIA